MDPGTAQRARGVSIDWADTVQGSGLTIDNPNAPANVKALSVRELKARLDAGDVTLVDVRPRDERAVASLAAPFRTLDDGIDALTRLPKDTAWRSCATPVAAVPAPPSISAAWDSQKYTMWQAASKRGRAKSIRACRATDRGPQLVGWALAHRSDFCARTRRWAKANPTLPVLGSA